MPELSTQFLPTDVPPVLGLTEADMRPYAYIAAPIGSEPAHWQQLDGFEPAMEEPPGIWLARGRLASLEGSQVFAAQPGLVAVTEPAQGALLGALPVPVAGTARLYDISQGVPGPCAGFSLTVNDTPVTIDCGAGGLGSFVTSATLNEGSATITARLVGPSGDVSLDRVEVEVDVTPPEDVTTTPSEGDTFHPGARWFEARYEDAHAVTPIIEQPPATAIHCDGETTFARCFRFSRDWAEGPSQVRFRLIDDAGNDTGPITVTFWALAVAEVRGRVVNAVSDPVEGIGSMPVLVVDAPPTVPEVLSGPDGSFVIVGPPDDLNGLRFLRFDASRPGAPRTANGCLCATDCPFAAFTLAANVELDAGVYELPEDVRLPPIHEGCHGVQVGELAGSDCIASSTGDVTVTEPGGDAVLTIPGDTKLSQLSSPGSCGPWTVTVTEVPSDSTPQSLPDEMSPSIIVTVQPSGLVFEPPPGEDVAIRFKNRVAYDPGDVATPNEMMLYSVDRRNDQFDQRGAMTITADWLEPQPRTSIGIAGWHCPHAPTVDGGTGGAPPGGCDLANLDGGDCGPCPGQHQGGRFTSRGSDVSYTTGDLVVDYALPSYRSLGVDRTLEFVYRSNTVNPIAMEPYDVGIPFNAAVPPYMQLLYTVAGVEGSEVLFATHESFDDADKGDTFRFTAAADLSSRPTGLYVSSLRAASWYPPTTASLQSPPPESTAPFDCTHPQTERRATTMRGLYPHVDARSSPYGAGWGIRGISRLYVGEDALLVVDGNGDRLVFRPAPAPLAGHEDLFVTSGLFGSRANGALVNQGGNLRGSSHQCGAMRSPRVADFNGDDIVDVVARDAFGDQAHVFIGRATLDDPFFPPGLVTAPPSGCRLGVATADFDSDGDDDVVCLRHDPATFEGIVELWRSDGAAVPGFASAGAIPLPTEVEEDTLVVGQFTGDAQPDVAALGANQVYLLAGLDESPFLDDSAVMSLFAANVPQSVQVVVANVDGILGDDLLVPTTTGLFALWGNGDGTFATAQEIHDTVSSTGVAFADLDGNLSPEIVSIAEVCEVDTYCAVVFTGTGRVWERRLEVPFGPASEHARFVQVGDFDGNADPDLALSIWFDDELPVRILDGLPGIAFAPYDPVSDDHPQPPHPVPPTCSWREGWGLAAGHWGQPATTGAVAYTNRDDHSRIEIAADHWQRTYPDGRVERYDLLGFLYESEDPNGNVWSFAYGPHDGVTRMIDPVGLETRLDYIGARLDRVVDPAGRETRFSHDGRGHLLSVADPENQTWTYDYGDDSENPAFDYLMRSRTSPRGVATMVEYDYDDDYGRLRQVTLPSEGLDPDVRTFSPMILSGAYPVPGTECTGASHVTFTKDVVATYADSEWGALERLGFTLDGRLTSYRQHVKEESGISTTYG